MCRESQRDAGRAVTARRCGKFKSVLSAIDECRIRNHVSDFTSTPRIIFVVTQFHRTLDKLRNGLARSNRISIASFEYNFNAFRDFDYLSNYRFRKEDIWSLVSATAWPVENQLAVRSRYAVTPILYTCVLMRRLASPARWCDLEKLLGMHDLKI